MQTTTQLELRRIADLQLDKSPARVHPPEQIQALQNSLRSFGFVAPVLISADGHVISGNGILAAAIAEGYTEVPCVLVEHLSEIQMQAYSLASNRLAEFSTWDPVIVSNQLQVLRDVGIDITLTGFTEADILAEPVESMEDDYTPELPEVPNCQPGQLWQLGRHRLLCGDATVAGDFSRLTEDVPCDLLLTDPPYNVDVTGGTKEHLKIIGDNQNAADFLAFLVAAFGNAAHALHPGSGFYIWHPDGAPALQFRQACAATKLVIHQCLIWVKNQATLGRQDYQWQHEPCLHGEALECGNTWDDHESCLYGWTPGKAHLWCSDRRQTTVLEYDKPSRSAEHPTMKPVRLFGYQIVNSTHPDARVLDPFGGSGTTMVACEQLGRTCLMLEKDPRWCDCIINRWESLTGQKAVLVIA